VKFLKNPKIVVMAQQIDVLESFFAHPHKRLLVIGGPCVLESDAINKQIGETLRDTCQELGLSFVFKASFDKANRSSVKSPRGPGMKSGLERLAKLRDSLGVPVTTDIHDASQCELVAKTVDMLQVPAFLCRQTDLLLAGAGPRATAREWRHDNTVRQLQSTEAKRSVERSHHQGRY